MKYETSGRQLSRYNFSSDKKVSFDVFFFLSSCDSHKNIRVLPEKQSISSTLWSYSFYHKHILHFHKLHQTYKYGAQ